MATAGFEEEISEKQRIHELNIAKKICSASASPFAIAANFGGSLPPRAKSEYEEAWSVANCLGELDNLKIFQKIAILAGQDKLRY